MRTLIRLFDRFLRRAKGVFEFCDDPDCLFRLQIARAPHIILLPDGEIPAGAKVLELHLWNERAPRLPPEGADLRVAIQGGRMLLFSCRAVAREIQRNPHLADVEAVGGVTVLFYPGEGSGGEQVFKRLGFSLFPYTSPLGRFGEFWENLYTWGLMWAFNAASLKQRRLLRLRRTEVWMSVQEFLRRHGTGELKGGPSEQPISHAWGPASSPQDRSVRTQ